MKKVIALMLAVLMLATLAFAKADVTPGTTIQIGKNLDGANAAGVKKGGTVTIFVKQESDKEYQISGVDNNVAEYAVSPNQYLLRSVTTTNYTLTNVKYKNGKNLIEKIWIDDSVDAVKISLKDDLTNTSVKDFDFSFKLKGRAKYTLRTDSEKDSYKASVSGDTSDIEVNDKVSLPDLDFTVIGTVGYGKVEVAVGGDDVDEIDDLTSLPIDGRDGDAISLSNDIIKFTSVTGSKTATGKRVAGAYTADAILTQEYPGDIGLTLEARVYGGDQLYLDVDTDAQTALLKSVADVTADIDFFKFTDNKDYVHFNSNAKLIFDAADEESYVYEVKNGKLYPVGEYSDDDGCWVVTTRTLGNYIVSTEQLTLLEGTDLENPDNANPDTGANDVVGIATALAAVALVSAAAISLKK